MGAFWGPDLGPNLARKRPSGEQSSLLLSELVLNFTGEGGGAESSR